MRTREEIWQQGTQFVSAGPYDSNRNSEARRREQAILEVLLDIRELLEAKND